VDRLEFGLHLPQGDKRQYGLAILIRPQRCIGPKLIGSGDAKSPGELRSFFDEAKPPPSGSLGALALMGRDSNDARAAVRAFHDANQNSGDISIYYLMTMAEREGFEPPDTVTRMPHFECGAVNHSATSPSQKVQTSCRWAAKSLAFLTGTNVDYPAAEVVGNDGSGAPPRSPAGPRASMQNIVQSMAI
jgi:hypothetical protein